MEEAHWARHVRRGLELSFALSVTLSPNFPVFTSPEALQTPYCWYLMEASLRRYDQLLAPSLAPLPSLKNARWC